MAKDNETQVPESKIGNLESLRGNLLAPVVVAGLDRPIPAWAAVIPFDADTEAVAERIAMRAFLAESVDDMLDNNSGTIPIEGLIGNHLRIEHVTLQRSTVTEENGIGVYVVIEFVDLGTGEKGVTTTSAKGIMMQLSNATVRGWLPFECTVAEVDTGKNGRSNPLHLAKVVDF